MLFILVFLFSGQLFAYNAFKGLSPKRQDELREFLKPGSKKVCEIQDFRNWYEKWFCQDDKDCSCESREELARKEYPEWRYNAYEVDQRAVLNCGVQLASRDGVLHHVKEFQNMSIEGWFIIEVHSGDELWRSLKAVGYRNHYKASRKNKPGLRSPVVGVGLHWLKESDNLLSTHIDLENPGTIKSPLTLLPYGFRSLRHINEDLWGWDNRTPQRIVKKSTNHCNLSQEEKQLLGM